MSLKFRASSCGQLLPDPNRITESQLERIIELERERDTLKNYKGNTVKWTTNKETELGKLITKRDTPSELGAGAKSLVKSIWRKEKYKFDPPVVTKELFKGLLCEQDAFDLADEFIPHKKGIRIKNTQRFENDYITGMPDDLLQHEKILEDMKCPINLKTYEEAGVNLIYYAQLQGYMWLTGFKKARLVYCLVDTPEELVLQEKMRFVRKFDNDEYNDELQTILNQLDSIHNVSWIPAEKRIKWFEFDYNPKFIEELKQRIILARTYFQKLDIPHGLQEFDTTKFDKFQDIKS